MTTINYSLQIDKAQ